MTPAASVPPIEFVALPSESDLRAIVTELYACHYLLRNFGLSAEELYVAVPLIANLMPPAHHVCVFARRGAVEAVFTLQQVEPEWQHAIFAAWTQFIEGELPSTSEAELDRLVNASQVRGHAAAMLKVLAMKGLLAQLDSGLN